MATVAMARKLLARSYYILEEVNEARREHVLAG